MELYHSLPQSTTQTPPDEYIEHDPFRGSRASAPNTAYHYSNVNLFSHDLIKRDNLVSDIHTSVIKETDFEEEEVYNRVIDEVPQQEEDMNKDLPESPQFKVIQEEQDEVSSHNIET